MLKPKKKLLKKEVKEDKFVKTAMQAKNMLEENYSTVMFIVIGIFAIIAIISFLTYINKEKVEKANALLGQAQLEFQNFNYMKARQFVDRLIEEYDGKDAAAQGRLLLANLDFQENKYEDAKENYKEFIDSYGGSNNILASGYAGYAACLEHEGLYEEAAENFETAWKKAPRFIEAPGYLYLAGLNYSKAGDRQYAQELFNRIIQDYSDSDKAEDAKIQLIMLANKSD